MSDILRASVILKFTNSLLSFLNIFIHVKAISTNNWIIISLEGKPGRNETVYTIGLFPNYVNKSVPYNGKY